MISHAVHQFHENDLFTSAARLVQGTVPEQVDGSERVAQRTGELERANRLEHPRPRRFVAGLVVFAVLGDFEATFVVFGLEADRVFTPFFFAAS